MISLCLFLMVLWLIHCANVFAGQLSHLIITWVFLKLIGVWVTFISLRRWVAYTRFTVHIVLEPSSPAIETREKLLTNTASSDTERSPITRLLVNGIGFEFRRIIVPWVSLTQTVRYFGSWFGFINSWVIPWFPGTSNCLCAV